VNMLEKAARAACEDAGFDPDEIMANGGPRWRYYAPTVRAVLAAIRDEDDITDEMLEAGRVALHAPENRHGAVLGAVFCAMLDAILEGESK
jgi:hypothetical protein